MAGESGVPGRQGAAGGVRSEAAACAARGRTTGVRSVHRRSGPKVWPQMSAVILQVSSGSDDRRSELTTCFESIELQEANGV